MTIKNENKKRRLLSGFLFSLRQNASEILPPLLAYCAAACAIHALTT